MTFGARIFGVEVERVVGEGDCREERVVARGQRAAPVVLEAVAGVELLEGVSIAAENETNLAIENGTRGG